MLFKAEHADAIWPSGTERKGGQLKLCLEWKLCPVRAGEAVQCHYLSVVSPGHKPALTKST